MQCIASGHGHFPSRTLAENIIVLAVITCRKCSCIAESTVALAVMSLAENVGTYAGMSLAEV
jgi:hypothetical protein